MFPAPDLPPTELAYLAGLLDGEGHIAVRTIGRRNERGWGTVITIGMTDPQAIDWVHARFPGTRQVRQQRADWRPTHLWSVYNGRAAALLQVVLPYLVTKRRQAELVIAFAEDLHGSRGRGVRLTDVERSRRQALYEESLLLNRRGAA